ncbi:MAG: NRDE family protein [Pseudomonadota bacterium]
MCLIMLAWREHPEVDLLLAANRDEAFDRPSLDLHVWDTPAGIVGGRDRQAGGAWLAVHTNGRFGVVTNFRETPPDNVTRSRGDLVPRWLSSGLSQAAFAEEIATAADDYAGFNLLYGDRQNLYYATNRHSDHDSGPLPPGTYALSNALLDTPWPKVTAARAYTQSAIRLGSIEPDHYFAFLRDRTQAQDEVLPEEPGSLERRRLLSAPFILGEHYGTRCSTLVSVGRTGETVVTEQHYQPGGAPDRRHALSLTLPR